MTLRETLECTLIDGGIELPDMIWANSYRNTNTGIDARIKPMLEVEDSVPRCYDKL
jgi:hypothetical protein